MATSLSNLFNNSSNQLYNNCFDCKNPIDYMVFKDDKIVFTCFECKQNTGKDFNNEVIERFKNTYQFCENENKKFLMMLRKGVYAFEYMDSWNKFDELKIPLQNEFYSESTMEHITNSERAFKTFNNKN